VVTHPSEWEMSGFNEIQKPPERYGVWLWGRTRLTIYNN
jgi:hypothetical protein